MKARLHCILFALALCASVHQAAAQGTAFTYQGRLDDNGSPANGHYDFQFILFNVNQFGFPVGPILTNANVLVSNGLFTTTMDFGTGVLTGTNLWLDISVRTTGGGAFTDLTPRQPLTPAPYAVFANTASNISGTVSAMQISGAVASANLTGTYGNPVTLNNAGDNFSGTFTGNGGGLTNVTAAALATPPGMALIPAGVFTMGNSIGDSDITDAIPTTITVSAFYLDVNVVTYAQWQSVYFWATNHGYSFVNAGFGKGANKPVQALDWYDTLKWCNARSQLAGRAPVYYEDAGMMLVYTNGEGAPYVNWSANGYRLPTEAEWEKAARGGLSGQRFPWGNVITENLANYVGATNSYSYDLGPNGYNAAFTNGDLPYTSPVGSFAANGYGLYDMAGNIWEWCWDWYGTPYGQPTTTNPTGPAAGSSRVLRGGPWFDLALFTRCANRFNADPATTLNSDLGFRCVRGL